MRTTIAILITTGATLGCGVDEDKVRGAYFAGFAAPFQTFARHCEPGFYDYSFKDAFDNPDYYCPESHFKIFSDFYAAREEAGDIVPMNGHEEYEEGHPNRRRYWPDWEGFFIELCSPPSVETARTISRQRAYNLGLSHACTSLFPGQELDSCINRLSEIESAEGFIDTPLKDKVGINGRQLRRFECSDVPSCIARTTNGDFFDDECLEAYEFQI